MHVKNTKTGVECTEIWTGSLVGLVTLTLELLSSRLLGMRVFKL